MSKVTIAFASFAFGVLTSFLVFSGSQASILAQAPSPQSPAPAPQTLAPLLMGGAGIPTVPPITQHFTRVGLAVPGTAFGVDGSECVSCVFNGMTLRYGGGNFQFTDFKFSGPVRFELTGAAANTVIFMRFIEALAASQAPPKPTMQNAPIIKTAMVKETVTGSFGTPK
jgi:hypothetical protein